MRQKSLFVMIILLLVSAKSYAEQKTFRLNTAFVPPISVIFEETMKEAFKRNGLNVTFTTLPAEISIQQANNGIDDGDGPRIAGLTQKYPNLIQVPEKLIDVEFSAFSKNTAFEPNGWESLKPYRVGIVIGWKILEDNIVGTKQLEKVNSVETLFKFLDSNRIDIAVIGKLDGLSAIKSQGLKDIQVLQPSLAVREMFLYLNKKHKDMVPQISSALKSVKEDGTYQKIVNQTLGK